MTTSNVAIVQRTMAGLIEPLADVAANLRWWEPAER
jgi:hypothetical protein